jgi:hypothetical protein
MKNTMKAAVAMMAFGVVAFGSATASAYTPSTRCETVTTKKVVDAPGTRRDRVVTTTTRECDPRRATPARPVKRVVKTSPRLVVRNGRVVYVAPRVVKTRAVVTRPRAAATRTVTTTTVKKKATPRRATTVTTTTTTNRKGKTVVKTKAVKKASKGRSRRGR